MTIWAKPLPAEFLSAKESSLEFFKALPETKQKKQGQHHVNHMTMLSRPRSMGQRQHEAWQSS